MPQVIDVKPEKLEKPPQKAPKGPQNAPKRPLCAFCGEREVAYPHVKTCKTAFCVYNFYSNSTLPEIFRSWRNERYQPFWGKCGYCKGKTNYDWGATCGKPDCKKKHHHFLLRVKARRKQKLWDMFKEGELCRKDGKPLQL